MKTLLASLFLAAPAFAAEVQSNFVECFVQSGPQTRAESLQIPNELLDSNAKKIDALVNGKGNGGTYLNLRYDAQTEKITIDENQEFDDLASEDSEVKVQLGGYGDIIYASLETKFGSSYARSEPREVVRGKVWLSEVYLQHVNYGEGRYADLRLTCTYRKTVN